MLGSGCWVGPSPALLTAAPGGTPSCGRCRDLGSAVRGTIRLQTEGALWSPPGLQAELGLPIPHKVPVEEDELQSVLNFLFGLS